MNDFPLTGHPQLYLDVQRCKRNIDNMIRRTTEAGSELRPHMKTHQSRGVAQWFRKKGIRAATVSSTGMALYFAEDGWSDFTIAFPFYRSMIADLIVLQETADLRIFIHRPDDIRFLTEHLEKPFRFYIEIDLWTNPSP